MPTFSLGFTISSGSVPGNIYSRILARQGVRTAIIYNVLVFADPDSRYLFTIHDKGWVCAVSGAVDHVAHFKLRHVNHNGRDSLVVINQLVVRCYHFQGKFC